MIRIRHIIIWPAASIALASVIAADPMAALTQRAMNSIEATR